MRWLAALLIIALSGCLGGGSDGGPQDDPDPDDGSVDPGDDPGDPADPTPPRTPMLVGFSYGDCIGARSIYHATEQTAASRLPEGYEVRATSGQTGDHVAVEYFFVQCASFNTSSSALDDTVYGSVSIAIEPPANATVQADEAWYRVRMFVTGDVLEQVWQAAQYNVYKGGFSQERAAPTVPATNTALGDYMQSGLEQGSGAWAGSHAYFTETERGRLEWVGDVDAQTITLPAGTFDVATDDPFAQPLQEDLAPQWTHTVVRSGSFTQNFLWRV